MKKLLVATGVFGFVTSVVAFTQTSIVQADDQCYYNSVGKTCVDQNDKCATTPGDYSCRETPPPNIDCVCTKDDGPING